VAKKSPQNAFHPLTYQTIVCYKPYTMTPRTPPGQTREKIYQFVRQRLLDGFPPTVREIQQQFGFSAVQTVQEHLRRLVDEGRLIKQKGKARGYALPESDTPAPTPPMLLVPLLGRVQAGGLNTAVEDCEGYIPVPAGPVPAGPGMTPTPTHSARAGNAAPHGASGDSGHTGGSTRERPPANSAAAGHATMKPASGPADQVSAGGDAHLRATPHAADPTGQLFALRVHGESMTGAGIMPGDVVIVRSQPTANSGDIVVALVDDEATVKRLRLSRGRVELRPENPEFEPLVFSPDECVILGKVIEVRRYVEPLTL
jgi:SOS-response transcriptional repressor LexA